MRSLKLRSSGQLERHSPPLRTRAHSPCFRLLSLVCIVCACRVTDGMRSFRTSSYVLHLYEAPTGYRFVMLAEHGAGDLRPHLKFIYSTIFVEYVLKNPLYEMGTPIECSAFEKALDRRMSSAFPPASGSGGPASAVAAVLSGKTGRR